MTASRRPEQRAARATARADDEAVRGYLLALRRQDRPPRTTAAAVREQLDRVRSDLRGAPPLEELLLLQRHRDLESELRSIDRPVDLDALEAGFVAVAARYGDAKCIGYETWLDLGVSPDVLETAGISPSGD